MKLIATIKLFAALCLLSFLLSSCEKQDEMVLDRVQSPVLVTIQGLEFTANETVNVTATIYELDKSGLLDHTVGIDSIPVTNLSIQVRANGIPVGDFTTSAAGKVAVAKTWQELGIATPARGNAVNLEWSGFHKGQAFTKLSKVQVK